MKKVLFVCIENSNRSQMAEAFLKIHGKDAFDANSAGSKPSGKINPKAIEAMKMLGYDITQHQSKSIAEFANVVFDYVITMGCGDNCPYIAAKVRQDWQIPDPKEMDMTDFIQVRNTIEQKVLDLIQLSNR